jgi:hypothetical protein
MMSGVIPFAVGRARRPIAVVRRIEVYGSLHGWCVPDMPLQNGEPIYDIADAVSWRLWAVR